MAFPYHKMFLEYFYGGYDGRPERPGLTIDMLVDRIEEQRAVLLAWRTHISEYKAALESDLAPVKRELQEVEERFAHILDAIFDQPERTDQERRTLSSTIALIAATLIEEDIKYLPLKALYDKHSASRYDDLVAAKAASYGVEFSDDFHPETLADIEREASDILSAIVERSTANARASRPSADDRAGPAAHEQAPQRQSMRYVFRKIVSLLHPDREADEEKRLAKTSLMQKANVAYEKGDLDTLTELQRLLRIPDAPPPPPDPLIAKRLALQQELEQVEAQLRRLLRSFFESAGPDVSSVRNPSSLKVIVAQNVSDFHERITALQSRIAELNDPALLKSWLANQRFHAAFRARSKRFTF